MSVSDTSATQPSPARTIVVRAGEGPRHALRHDRGVVENIVGHDVGTSGMLVHRVTIHPGSDPGPYHLHRHAENVYLALEGDLEVIADGRREKLGPGDAIVIPPGHPHLTHNPGTKPAVLLAIYDRPVVDDFEIVNLGQGASS